MKAFIRIWKTLDVEEIKKALFVIGQLSGECFHCHNMGIPVDSKVCPFCGTRFRFVAFRRKTSLSVIDRFKLKHPDSVFIEFDDFKKSIDRDKVRKILDI